MFDGFKHIHMSTLTILHYEHETPYFRFFGSQVVHVESLEQTRMHLTTMSFIYLRSKLIFETIV